MTGVGRIDAYDCGVGIIDEDPGSTFPRDFRINYLQEYAFGSLKLYRHKDKTKCFVVMLCPRLEEWYISRAHVAGIRLTNFGLPEDGEKLHAIPHYEQKKEFDAFLEKLLAAGDAEVEKVREWLRGE